MQDSLRQILFALSLEYAEQRIAHAEAAIRNATESGNDETKSTAGDKHETGRAMAQLEQEKAAKQRQEALNLRDQLLKIDPSLTGPVVRAGSVVITDNANFYVAIAAGKIKAEGLLFHAVSAGSPIGQQLLGKQAGDVILMGAATYRIREVI